MMNQRYRHTIDDEKTVSDFWGLTPAKLLAKKPDIELPTKRRIQWPEKNALKKLAWEKPLMHAAKDIGVSDVESTSISKIDVLRELGVEPIRQCVSPIRPRAGTTSNRPMA